MRVKPDNRAIREHYEKWRGLLTSCGATNRELAEQALGELYRQLGHEPPSIVWCQSLYQFVMLPSLFVGILHSDAWHAVSNTLLAEDFTDEQWEKQWDAAWQMIWFETAQPLVHGMTHWTSRIAQQYPGLDEPLLAHAKKELGLRLRSGKMRRFESKLKREIYRSFWNPQAWVPALALVHADAMSNKLGSAMQFHRRDFDIDWSCVMEAEADLNAYSGSIHDNIVALFMRMGLEPSTQMRKAKFLPFLMPPMATHTFWREVLDCDFARESEELGVWLDLCEAVSGVICVPDIAFVCEKPLAFKVNERGAFHCEDGPALTYSDGFTLYAWHGVIVEKELIEHPEDITIEAIEANNNAEVRRVMIERFGQARYLQESGAVAVHEDDFGVLYRKELPGDEPLVMVKVVNSTPEPDGTYKDYFLRVPPTITTAREAVAWTFYFDGEDPYKPQIET